jgi:hypothetical protein
MREPLSSLVSLEKGKCWHMSLGVTYIQEENGVALATVACATRKRGTPESS